jgi:hypothetical protein
MAHVARLAPHLGLYVLSRSSLAPSASTCVAIERKPDASDG